MNEDDLREAIERYERAIQIDPGYAAAWAGLSDAWLERGIRGAKTFHEAETPSREAALEAVELDTNLAEAHVALSRIKFHFETDWSGAEQEAKRALQLDPGSRDAHFAHANLLMALGRHDEAIRHMQNAAQLDPLSSKSRNVIWIRWPRGLNACRRCRAISPAQIFTTITIEFRVAERPRDPSPAFQSRDKERTPDLSRGATVETAQHAQPSLRD